MVFAIILAAGLALLSSCGSSIPRQEGAQVNPAYADTAAMEKQALADYHRLQYTLTKSIVEDVFSPPVASRIYAYASLASWETLAALSDQHPSLMVLWRDTEPIPPPPSDQILAPVAAIQATLQASKALVFNEDLLKAWELDWINSLPGDPAIQASLNYGIAVAERVLAQAAKDGYAQSRTYPKHGDPEKESDWVPTPPLFMGGIEPHWNLIRSFTLDSANQFIPPGPLPFSSESNSEFFDLVREVHHISINLDEEQEAIARFWDCNPYVTEEQAHLMPGIKKITPGGHWMSIAGLASRAVKADMDQTIRTYTWTAIALHDAFISCWDEKYRSNLIRPETVINRFLDPDWKPLLETPPFPEYTSGHSVISTSAAEVLSHLIGPDFTFIDSTELEYGLPLRQFSSFRQAAAEAAASRIYGGIHYRPAVELGVDQGRAVGLHVLEHLMAIDSLAPGQAGGHTAEAQSKPGASLSVVPQQPTRSVSSEPAF